jgi:hypothetical protein
MKAGQLQMQFSLPNDLAITIPHPTLILPRANG